jgi:tubulin polyglutamylase TTLL9
VYLYRTGFGRFTHHRYTNNIDDIHNNYVHLTNVAIQKTSENYDERLGGKWDLRGMKLYLMSKYGSEKVSECFFLIQDLIIKTLQSVQKIITNDKHCFELYGFDVLLDDALKPWLIEVNASPSMTANTP